MLELGWVGRMWIEILGGLLSETIPVVCVTVVF